MAADVAIVSWHGASGSEVATELADGAAIRFKQADNDTVDTNNKIPIPTSGTNYSFIKNFQFEADTAPSNLIDNLKVYSDGANGLGTGVDLRIRTNATYTDPVANGTAQLGGTSSVFTYTSGSPLAVTGSTSGTGTFGHYIQMQMSVGTTAGPGTTPSETITFSYDES